MRKVSASVGSTPSGGLAESVASQQLASEVPAWLAARRARQTASEVSTAANEQFESLPTEPRPIRTDSDAAGDHPTDELPVLPPLVAVTSEPQPGEDQWTRRIVSWLCSAAMTGFTVSVIVHAILLITLALMIVKGHELGEVLNVVGILGHPDGDPEADLILDTVIDFDSGKDAAPLEFSDLTQVVNPEGIGFNPGDVLRGTANGKGTGDGTGGDGDALTVPPVGVPTYAVTKGSFSAWTEPKDPDPGRTYVIVIHVRLPDHIKKYRASDLTGMVVGTDLYKQVIKFRSTEEFPIKDRAVQVRVPVPGADRLVRDTIRIESRLLREKQILQIEF